MKVEIKMRQPNWLDRAWYHRIGETSPLCSGSTRPRHAQLARLAPYRCRTFHRLYAELFGFFWLPCPRCDRPFGGHETGKDIPDPTRPPGWGLSICSQCSKDRP